MAMENEVVKKPETNSTEGENIYLDFCVQKKCNKVKCFCCVNFGLYPKPVCWYVKEECEKFCPPYKSPPSK